MPRSAIYADPPTGTGLLNEVFSAVGHSLLVALLLLVGRTLAMTIPVVRKRAKKPKVRTGCRTCRQRHIKCDEERPGCQRCSIAGRECGGYDVVLPSGKGVSASQAVLLPKGKSVDLPTLYNTICWSPSLIITDGMTEHEVFAFDHFRLETVRKLPGSSWTLSWERLALQMGHHEPAVTHAAIALGSIHRAISGDGDGVQHEFALQQYNKAMGYVRKYIENLHEGCPDEDVEVVLLVSLLFFCFEVLHAEDARATLHLHTGLRILYERVRKPMIEGEEGVKRREVIMPTTPKNNMDVLVQTFVRLDSDLTIVGEDEPYLSPVCREKLPTSFYSLEEAMVHLDAISAQIHDLCRDIVLLADELVVQKRPDYQFLDDDCKSCLSCAYSRTIPLTDRPDLTSRMLRIKKDLQTWMGALANVSTTTQQQSAQILTQIHFFYIWFVVSTWRDDDEVACDRFDEQFEHILNQMETYVDLNWSSTSTEPERERIRKQNASTRQAFTLGTDLVPCLALISFKSRTSSIRRRCVDLLRTINLQGVFDNYFLASFCEEIWLAEEAAARALTGKPVGEDFQAHEIPMEVRFVEIELSPMQYKHDFYKADVGRMIMVMQDSEGYLVARKKCFDVWRPEHAQRKGGHDCVRAREEQAGSLKGWLGRDDDGLRGSLARSTLSGILSPYRWPVNPDTPPIEQTASPSSSSNLDTPSTDSLAPACSSYETRSARRVRGHMHCCCNQPHASEKEKEKKMPLFASYFGYQQKEDEVDVGGVEGTDDFQGFHDVGWRERLGVSG